MSPSRDLRVALLQQPLVWENAAANRAQFESLIEPLASQCDVLVLPEMFTTGFTMNAAAVAEQMNGPSVAWMKQMAQKTGALVMGSLVIEANGHRNRLVVAHPNGLLWHYDKRHLFSFAGENEHYSSGNERLIIELNGWRICPLVCYDLRFPVWSRNAPTDGTQSDWVYDALIYVANWPAARHRAWRTLLEARAHENCAYCIGLNRVGKDDLGIDYAGGSAAFSPKGEVIAEATSEAAVITVTLSADELNSYRQKFRAWGDKDKFELLP